MRASATCLNRGRSRAATECKTAMSNTPNRQRQSRGKVQTIHECCLLLCLLVLDMRLRCAVSTLLPFVASASRAPLLLFRRCSP